jgi:uncharacterized repeat protein (TIGR02543 family)
MPAPSNTVWGDINTNSNGQGRIGIAVTVSDLNYTTVRYTMQVWFWSRYRVTDSTNAFDIMLTDEDHWFTNWKNQSIKTTSNSAWSTANQVLIGSAYVDRTRTTSPKTHYLGTAYYNIEYGGGSGSCRVPYTVPALPLYTITYNANGGSLAPASHSYYYGYDTKLSTQIPYKAGYDFLGWSLSNTATSPSYQPGQAWGGTNRGNYTLYAVWKKQTYTITFDANGGTNAPDSMTVEWGTVVSVSDIPKPTRTNYLFLGWSENSTATIPQHTDGWSIQFSNSTTLYAVWKLDYINPKITNLSILRCDENMVADDYGNYVKIKFDWETYKDAVAYALYFNGIQMSRKALAGRSGSVEDFVKDSNNNKISFSIDIEYDVQLNVADNMGHSTELRKLNSAFIPIDFTENMKSVSFGAPCPEEDGLMNIAFDKVNIAPKDEFLYKGENFFGQKRLWNGNSVMNETHSIVLSKPISETKNGIVLVFGRDGSYGLCSFFVPKASVIAMNSGSWTFLMCTSLLDYVGAKTIIISNDLLSGHTENDVTAKNPNSGITYHNEAFYLKYVYEV